jgi:membrane protein DedA with SNARE-associated domain
MALVFGDAICALLPGETTLNAASTLAAEGELELWLVIVAGGVGAIAGDSALYWLARRFSGRIQPQLDKATANDKIRGALDLLGERASILLVAGRYVPGARLIVNATLGLSHCPTGASSSGRRWGGLWAIYTCVLAYVVARALSGFPLASVIISGALTTIAIGAVIVVLRRGRNRPSAEAAA